MNQLPFPLGGDVRFPVLLDTDIGSNVDDLFALLFALGSPKLRLVGVTTVYGDTRLRAKGAHSVLEMAGHHDVPVGYGIEMPLSGKSVFWIGHEGEGYNLRNCSRAWGSCSCVPLRLFRWAGFGRFCNV